MVKQDRISRRVTALLESLETRSLLSLISAPPTLEVLPSPGVRFNREGGISITQPAAIHVYGTAQPGAPGTTVQVSIYAEDSEGNLVNGGAPLATVTPDFLGKYSAVVSLPSMLRKDVNFLVARETASAAETASLTINGTTVNNLSGSVQVDPGTLTGLTGSVSNPSTTVTGVGGTITTPSTPISNLGGTITTPVYPISTPSGAGTAGPSTGTLLGGTGTLGAQVGTLGGGTGTISASSSTLTQSGSATESSRTGSFSGGTGTIAGTTGESIQFVQEVATSTPIMVLIHQPKAYPSLFATAAVGSHRLTASPRATGHILGLRRGD